MSSVYDQGPPPPCPAPFNMAAHVLARASEMPDKTALAVLRPSGADRWSYARLEAAIRGTAAGFLSHGLSEGDRVLMRLGNTVDFPITYLAAIAAGLIPVPTSFQLTVGETEKIAAEIAPALVVAANGVALPEAQPCSVLTLRELQALRDLPPAGYSLGDPERPAYLIYTSGTSGQPRAVSHAHRAIWARRMMWQGWYGLAATDRLLHAGAFNWTYTLGTGLMDPWSVGATALIPGPGVTPDMLPLLLKRHDATIFAAAPGVYRQMLKAPMPALTKLRHGLSAGEKLPDTTRAAWEEATGTAIHEAFGMSECSTFISSSPGRPAPAQSLGFPQPGRRVAILGADGPVPRGEPGIIAVHASDPGLMLGYLGAGVETKARYQGDWFLTGDTGAMDAEGAITYLGRADDMMNAGGYRVSPIEVETAMRRHPGITDCAAVEVEIKPDVTVIAAFYTADVELPGPELKAHAEAHLARYKQPRLYLHRADLPRGANNKLLRGALRDGFDPSRSAH